jgi:hypothetical protein
MNSYYKYAPNVYLAKCEESHEKGETIIIETKYGKENEHLVHNLIGQKDGCYYYSITRADGFDNKERARRRLEKLNSYAHKAEARSDEWWEKSKEGKDFLALAEPIKVGHHSEKRHRALIERNHNRMSNAMKELDKAEAYRERTAYWVSMANKIDLSMPESLDYYEFLLERAKAKHEGLKNGTIEKEHAYSLTYAKKEVNEIGKKLATAKKLWE